MALFKQEELPTLVSASEAKSVADSAPFEAEKMALAKLINSSANTGQYRVLYNHPISDEALEELKSQGYEVIKRSKLHSADPESQYIISWN